MEKKKLVLGESLTGLIVDGIADTPYVAGLLTYDTRGVRVEVPYISEGVKQFESVSSWAKDMHPPSNLLFICDRQSVTLYGCRVTSARETIGGNGLSTVQITPREVVFKDREGDHDDDLKVTEMRSRIDGLSEWTNFRSTSVTPVSDDAGLAKKLIVEVESKPPVSWTIGDVTFSLKSDWTSNRNGLGLEVHEWVNLHTSFDTPRTCDEHLAEQRKFVSLLALIYGTAVCFRQHSVRDSRFNARGLTGALQSNSFYELVSSATVGDYERPKDKKKFSRGLSGLAQVTPRGLENWFSAYSEWERVIQPIAGTLQRPQSFVEDHVVNACIGLEAAGHIIGTLAGEEATYPRQNPVLATHIYRCLQTVGLDWTGVATSTAALAKGIAKIYNDLKHYDRFDYPPGEHSYLIGKVAILTARLLSLRLFDAGIDLSANFEAKQALMQIEDNMTSLGLHINEDGHFIPLTVNTP